MMNNSIPSVAGVVLTLNEESCLSRALASLDWCDELLVLDSGSTDKTASIAAQYGAKLVVHRQSPPFKITDQRNWALNHCGLRSQWVFFLDADEQVSSALYQNIISVLSQPTSFNAFHLTPRFWFFGRWLKKAQGYPNWHPRLCKREDVSFVGGVWEAFSKDAIIGYIYTPYEHFPFSKGIDEWTSRHLRYAEWEAITTIDFLKTRNVSSLSTSRFIALRQIQAKLWPLRPLFRFVQKYLLNLGFLEGWQGLVYALLISFYDLLVVVKILEKKNAK